MFFSSRSPPLEQGPVVDVPRAVLAGHRPEPAGPDLQVHAPGQSQRRLELEEGRRLRLQLHRQEGRPTARALPARNRPQAASFSLSFSLNKSSPGSISRVPLIPRFD